MITTSRTLLFRLFPLLILLLLLVLTEIVLRVCIPSLDSPLVTTVQNGGSEEYEVNRSALAKYFSADNVIVPELKPSHFKKKKSANCFRVLCLGESSMLGTPYQMNANIPSILRKQLRHRFPDREFEVINLGAAAVNSNVIVDLAAQAIEYEPDLVVAYMGHNEFYGPDGVGASFVERHFPFLIPLKYHLRELRIVAWFQHTMRSFAASAKSGERNLMKEVSQEDRVPLNSPDAEWVFKQFESNLGALTKICTERHIPLILSDVTSNLMFPPFAFDSLSSGESEEKSIASAEQCISKTDYATGLETLAPLRSLDPTNSRVNYWMGRIYLAAGNIDSARLFLSLARDNDLLKFRAPGRCNEIIRRFCATECVPLISADSLFCALSVNDIPGRELFWEHLHPTVRGYYEIADLYFQKILELHLVQNSASSNESVRLLPFQMDSLSICWLDLAFADIAMRNLTKHWPFNNYTSRTVVIESADNALQTIAFDLYSSKISWSEGCLRTAVYFHQHGRFREAATTYEALLEEYPTNYYSHYLLGLVYKEMGELEKATDHYSASIAYNPQYPYPRIDLGLIEINEGRIEDAVENFKNALRFTQGKGFSNEAASIYYGLSAASANKGDFVSAKKYIDTSLSLSPFYQPAQILRNKLLNYK